MDARALLGLELAAFFLAAAIGVAGSFRQDRASVGLVLAYFAGMIVAYVLGAALYLLPAPPTGNLDLVELGFRQTTLGALAFAAGTFWARRAPSTGNDARPGPSAS